VLFCCENNLYAMGTAIERSESQTDLCAKAASYGVPTLRADGQDIVSVHETTQRAQREVRGGRGPFFVEYRTYRFRAHSMFDAELYRDKREVEEWKTRGPLHTFSARLKAEGKLTEEQFLALDRDVGAEVDRAVAFAEAGNWEPVEDLTSDLYTPPEMEEK
jgi:pyruvate dehydrogenase E1 component alpha subunit